MHFRTKISGSVGDNISKLELIIKDDGGRVQVKKQIKLSLIEALEDQLEFGLGKQEQWQL